MVASVRFAAAQEILCLSRMFHSLWPDGSVEDHASELRTILADQPNGMLPNTVLVAEVEGDPIGFVQAGLRSHADGCDPRQPVGFIEGWYVAPAFRLQGIGAVLIAAAEEWARKQGCVEMASDTWLDNLDSQSAHHALGYEIVDRCVHYRKKL